jgi:hypothetical protein
MKPVYLKRLGRERQHGLIKVYFFMAFVYMKLYTIQHNSCLEQVVHVGPTVQCRVLLQDIPIPSSDQADDLHDGGTSR